MNLKRMSLFLVCLIISSETVFAQEKTKFDGTWVSINGNWETTIVFYHDIVTITRKLFKEENHALRSTHIQKGIFSYTHERIDILMIESITTFPDMEFLNKTDTKQRVWGLLYILSGETLQLSSNIYLEDYDSSNKKFETYKKT